MYSVLIRAFLIFALLVFGCGGSSDSESPNPGPPAASQIDTDNDGVPDSSDAFPNDPNESADFDGDGVGDNEDNDDDNDGVPDDVDAHLQAQLKSGRVRVVFHTENPNKIMGPVKVLFAIDCSLTMLDSDPGSTTYPAGRRVAAVREFIERYNTEAYPDVSFGILLWSANTLEMTQNVEGNEGFTRSTEELNRVLDNARLETHADYLNAITMIRSMVEDDIKKTDNQESGRTQLSRSKYIICFLSDGMPHTDTGRQSSEDIWHEVEQLKAQAQKFNVGAFNFNTFFLSSRYRDNDGNYLTQPPGLVADRHDAEDTLMGMAQRADGTYQDFANIDTIDFINFTDLRLANEYKIKFLMACNYMVRPHGTIDALRLDSDGDGLTDEEEIDKATDPTDRDTDDDGLSDYFEYSIQATDANSGQLWPNPLVNDSGCQPPAGGVWADQDSDGLTDCEESIKGTWHMTADVDADCIPDGIETASGTNPFEPIYPNDSDLDSVLDVFEVQGHTNVLVDDPILRERYAYKYSIVDHGHPGPDLYPDLPLGIRRYIIDITNVGLMDTQGAEVDGILNGGDAMNPGDNVLRLYIAQVPGDRPDDPAFFRMAEATLNFHGGEDVVVLSTSDFKLLP